ncbi:DUF6528 family protein [Amycolatopsis sp. cmx-4-54]|uniref:DUF6528 family protein n=1 Tax=Amycolatopsis sp. cmx-4-54 TaxID=2790936 RepID=UPI00397E807F
MSIRPHTVLRFGYGRPVPMTARADRRGTAPAVRGEPLIRGHLVDIHVSGRRHPPVIRGGFGLPMKIMWKSLAALVIAGLSVAASAPAAADAGARDRGSIVITEQASKRILVLPADRASWQNRKVSWAWAPNSANGLADLAGSWSNPSDAKLAERGGEKYLLTSASGGFAAVVPYPAGDRAYWAANVGGPANPHSIELLPDGNVAVAASTGGWVRIYTASQGQRSTAYTEYRLVGAHGVVWDAGRNVLWALGTDVLVALKVGGTPGAPVLTEQRSVPVPTKGGHDLQPIPHRSDLLWVTTEAGVYQFSKTSGGFTQRYAGAREIDRPHVKSVSTNPRTGQVLTASVQEGHLCTWCTDTVRLAFPRAELALHGAWIYKARWWIG